MYDGPFVTGATVVYRKTVEAFSPDLVAADAATGKTRWTLPWNDGYRDASPKTGLSNRIDGVMAATDDLLLVPTNQSVLAVALADGAIRWSTVFVPRLSQPSRIIVRKKSAWRTLGNCLREAPLGKPKFREHYALPASKMFFGDLVGNETHLVARSESHFIGIAYANPKKAAWRVKAEAAFSSWAVVAGDQVLIGDVKRDPGQESCSAVTALALANGRARWSTRLTSSVEQLAVADDAVVVKGAAGQLWCCDLATGALRWEKKSATRPARDGEHGRMVVGDGCVFSVQADGKSSYIAVIDLATGAERERLAGNAPFLTYAQPAYADGRLFAYTEKSLLVFE